MDQTEWGPEECGQSSWSQDVEQPLSSESLQITAYNSGTVGGNALGCCQLEKVSMEEGWPGTLPAKECSHSSSQVISLQSYLHWHCRGLQPENQVLLEAGVLSSCTAAAVTGTCAPGSILCLWAPAAMLLLFSGWFVVIPSHACKLHCPRDYFHGEVAKTGCAEVYLPCYAFRLWGFLLC